LGGELREGDGGGSSRIDTAWEEGTIGGRCVGVVVGERRSGREWRGPREPAPLRPRLPPRLRDRHAAQVELRVVAFL
jgi:hypothetical protein